MLYYNPLKVDCQELFEDYFYFFVDIIPLYVIMGSSRMVVISLTTGTNIYNLRLKAGLSQKQLADILGVSNRTVSSWETNEKLPRMGVVQKMAAYFGVKKSDIICADEIEKPPTKDGKELSESERIMLDLFSQIPKESQQLVLDMIRTALKSQGLL